jgi:hypothetical protein
MAVAGHEYRICTGLLSGLPRNRSLLVPLGPLVTLCPDFRPSYSWRAGTAVAAELS